MSLIHTYSKYHCALSRAPWYSDRAVPPLHCQMFIFAPPCSSSWSLKAWSSELPLQECFFRSLGTHLLLFGWIVIHLDLVIANLSKKPQPSCVSDSHPVALTMVVKKCLEMLDFSQSLTITYRSTTSVVCPSTFAPLHCLLFELIFVSVYEFFVFSMIFVFIFYFALNLMTT